MIVVQIVPAVKEDLPVILKLQYLAYQSEAKLLNNFKIPPLKQTLEEVAVEYEKGTILKAVNEQGEIIGSVRWFVEGDTLFVGKLMVQPDLQGKGIGSQLLGEIERLNPNMRYELFTSDKSLQNVKLYERMGYVQYKVENIAPDLNFIYLAKV